MSSIVIDYRKCISIIDSCTKLYQLNDCENLADNFERKHRSEKTSFKMYKELYGHIKNRIKQVH